MKNIHYFAVLASALAMIGCDKDDKGLDNGGEHQPAGPQIETISFEDCEFADKKTNNLGENNKVVKYTEFGADFTHMNVYTMVGGVVVSSTADSSENGDSNSSHNDVNGDKEAETHGAESTSKFASFRLHSYVPDYDMSFAFAEGKERKIVSAYVNNSAYLYQKMKYGYYEDPGLVDGEYCEIVFTGYDTEGKETGKTSFSLGDFRDGKTFICSEWTKVDLSGLGTVNKVVLTVDVLNASGLIAPESYDGFSVCIDEISFELPAE